MNGSSGIYEKIKKDLLGSTRGPQEGNFFKNDNFDENLSKYYDIRKYILKDISNIKCLLVIGLKEITWRKELENSFDIHPSKITDFFNYMKKEGLILYKPLIEVDNLLFECVIKQNNLRFYSHRDEVKVYTLSPEGKDFIEKLIDNIIDLSNTRIDLRLELQNIINKTNIHIETMNKIKYEELNFLTRQIIYPDGLIENRNTIRKNNLKKLVYTTLLEIKLEKINNDNINGLITQEQRNELINIAKNELTIYKEDPKKKEKYNGIYSNLNNIELDKIINGVTKEEEKEANKEYNNKIKNNLIELNKDKNSYVARGYHCEEEIEQDKDIFNLLGIEK